MESCRKSHRFALSAGAERKPYCRNILKIAFLSCQSELANSLRASRYGRKTTESGAADNGVVIAARFSPVDVLQAANSTTITPLSRTVVITRTNVIEAIWVGSCKLSSSTPKTAIFPKYHVRRSGQAGRKPPLLQGLYTRQFYIKPYSSTSLPPLNQPTKLKCYCTASPRRRRNRLRASAT